MITPKHLIENADKYPDKPAYLLKTNPVIGSKILGQIFIILLK